MKKILKNYKPTIILLLAIIVGGIIGAVFKEDALVLKPLGTLFLNFLLISVVPLIFFSITSSICKMEKSKRLKKILKNIIIVFLFTSIISVLISFIVVKDINLINQADKNLIKESFDYDLEEEKIELNLLEKTVSIVSVNGFEQLFTTNNLLALIVVSIMLGISINKAGNDGKKVKEFMISANEVVLQFINIIMYYAPIGLGAYFATLTGELGSIITIGYLKTFVVYTVIAILFYVVIYSLYAYIAAGKKGVVALWKSIPLSSATALGTCSSAASVPVNIECTKKIGVPDDIAQTTVSLGTSFHKDGSCIGNVIKIMFLVCLFGHDISNISSILEVLSVAMISMLLISAVPSGGGTIAEMLIITLMGFPVAALPILTIIAVIIDAPATLLNVVGDSSSSMLVARLVEGKEFLKKVK